MKLLHTLHAVASIILFYASIAVADDPITFPPLQVQVKQSAVASTLTADLVYVIHSEVQFIPICSPEGMVKFVPEASPLKIKGRFIDAPGKTETRSFTSKYLYTVEPVTSGRCEIICVPVGATDAAKVQRRTIDVQAGEGPRPPPVPPEPKPTPSSGKFYVLIIEETEQAVAARGAMFNDQALASRFKEKGHKFRVVDQNVVGADGKPPGDIAPYLPLAAGKPLPQVFFIDMKDLSIRKQLDLPKTGQAAFVLSELTKAGG